MEKTAQVQKTFHSLNICFKSKSEKIAQIATNHIIIIAIQTKIEVNILE